MARAARWGAVAAALASTSLAQGYAAAAGPSVEDVAPAAAVAAAHATARDVLRALVARLPPDAARRLTGAYVAFDEGPADVSALAACDDDGDYVIVLSDPLLRLAATVAEAQALDETFGTHKLYEYAAFAASAPAPGARAAPPPVGFFDPAEARSPRKVALESARFREILAEVEAHELTHLVDGALVCSNPTATHERDDDVWSREEREHALAIARRLYSPLRVLAADGPATARVLDAGMTEQGGLAWLGFLDRVEGARPTPGSTYASLHPDSSVRAQVIRAAADQWRQIHASAGVARPASPATAPRAVSPPLPPDR